MMSRKESPPRLQNIAGDCVVVVATDVVAVVKDWFLDEVCLAVVVVDFLSPGSLAWPLCTSDAGWRWFVLAAYEQAVEYRLNSRNTPRTK